MNEINIFTLGLKINENGEPILKLHFDKGLEEVADLETVKNCISEESQRKLLEIAVDFVNNLKEAN